MDNDHGSVAERRLSVVKTDQEIADDLKRRLSEASAAILPLIEEASKNRFIVQITFGRDHYGSQTIMWRLQREF